MGDGIYHKIDVDKKPTNRCTVSSAWCTYHDFIQNGKQLWRQSGVLDKGEIIKPF
jgi:hypothetical protein